MITTGIIKNINVSSDTNHINNLYSVEIGILKTPISESEQATLECTCCLPGGIYDSYKEGDMVYIGFVNNLLNYPVILGRIYKGTSDVEPRSLNAIDNLNVYSSASLPENTSIGDISFSDLKKNMQIMQNLLSQFSPYSLLQKIEGFDNSESANQVLKNINGEIKWQNIS